MFRRLADNNGEPPAEPDATEPLLIPGEPLEAEGSDTEVVTACV